MLLKCCLPAIVDQLNSSKLIQDRITTHLVKQLLLTCAVTLICGWVLRANLTNDCLKATDRNMQPAHTTRTNNAETKDQQRRPTTRIRSRYYTSTRGEYNTARAISSHRAMASAIAAADGVGGPLAADLELLERTQALVAAERSLTLTMEKVEPWLTSSISGKLAGDNSNPGHFEKRVRPIPTSMDQVKQVLAVSRNFASRTSAPAGWNPNAPVVGFSTPNPLPHQLRGGALAALQLERARQAEIDKKRKRQEEEEQAKDAKRQAEAATADMMDMEPSTPKNSNQTTDPKRKDIDGANRAKAPTGGPSRPRAATRTSQQNIQPTTMNLSDSSSSSSEEDSDDE